MSSYFQEKIKNRNTPTQRREPGWDCQRRMLNLKQATENTCQALSRAGENGVSRSDTPGIKNKTSMLT